MYEFAVAAALGLIGFCASSWAADLQPLQVPVSTEWFGYDGSWSAVNVRVGSPQQWVSLFPSTLGEETWVIGASGCDETTACIRTRGGIFKSNLSSTWNSLGPYTLNFQPDLGVTGSADYGLDTIWIGDAISAPEQIVAVLNSTDFLLGSLGLGVIPSNFSIDNQATFLSSLVENQSAIPSHSYGYTAGAYYRLKGVPASLTLGGVDLNRFVPNDVSFDMATGYEPVVSINAITVSSSPLSTSATRPNWTEEPLSLLASSQAELFTIDSSTPFLWLPKKVCDAFELALNLTYNETLQLYLYGNGTGPSTLADWNMTFTFTIADSPGSSQTVPIKFPYESFNHQLTFPFPALNATFLSPAVEYFPLRRATNNTQHTIGRVFLQEAYLVVDYERNKFSISQARFSNDAVTNVELAAITRPENSVFGGPANSPASGLSTGAKIGAGVGAAAVIICIIGVLAFFFYRRRRRSEKGGPGSPPEKHGSGRENQSDGRDASKEAKELLASDHFPHEVAADSTATRHEMPANAPIEMPAEVPWPHYERDKIRKGQAPAELEPKDSSKHSSSPSHGTRSPQSASLPPYSPNNVGRQPPPSNSSVSLSLSSSSFHHHHHHSHHLAGHGSITPTSSAIGPEDQTPNQNTTYSSRNSYSRGGGGGGGVRGQERSSRGPVSPHAAVISPIASPERTPLLTPPAPPSASRSTLNLPGSSSEGASGDHAPPRRSVSRSSRFKEEGIATCNELELERERERAVVVDRNQNQNQNQNRFSWDDTR